ncbi:GroES-like protein [Lichtheimia hyalospora FSU 10163]|nr:GroES-like protein [Lichtheimia hyalospora FSU 10163]
MTETFKIPSTMHALQLVHYGPAEEALKYVEIKTPAIQNPTELLIKVKAVGINPIEAKYRAGNVPDMLFKSPPNIIGSDYAGVVVAKGSAVKDFEIGDQVYGGMHVPIGQEYGAYAEYLLVTLGKGAIMKKPSNMSFEEAAATGIACLTSFQGIVGLGKLPESGEKKILVIGASGGVGTYAVQVGKAIGANVVAICSEKNAEFVSSLGADRIVAYNSKDDMEKLKKEVNTYDHIFDCVGGDDYYNQLVGLLKKGCVYATAVGPQKHAGAEKVGFFGAIKMVSTVVGRFILGCRPYRVVVHLPWNRFADELHPFLANGSVKSVLRDDQIFDLKDGAKAHLKLESHRTVGKIVLRV